MSSRVLSLVGLVASGLTLFSEVGSSTLRSAEATPPSPPALSQGSYGESFLFPALGGSAPTQAAANDYSPLAARLRTIYELARQGNADQALSEARKLSAAFPSEPTPHVTVAHLLVLRSIYGEAEAEMKAAHLADPKNREILTQLGGVQTLGKNYAAAITSFETVLQAEPRNAIALMGLGLVADRQNRSDAAIQYYEAAARVSRRGLPLELGVNLARLYNRVGDYLKSIALLEAAPDRNVPQPEFHVVLGGAYLGAGRPDDAVREAIKAVEFYSRDDQVLLWAAEVFRQTGDHPRSLQTLNLVSADHTSEATFQIAETFAAMGDTERALGKYREAAGRNSDHGLASTRMISLLLNQRRFDEAKVALQELLRSDDVALAALDATGIAFQTKERFGEAEQVFHEAQKRFPAAPAPLYRLGVLYSALGKNDQAIASLRQLLEQQPDNDAALRLLAVAHLRAGRVDDAVNEARKVAAHPSTGGEGDLFLAEILTQAGNKKEAIAAYRRTLRVAPNSVAAMNNLAVLLAENQERTEAIAMARKALVIAGQSNPAVMDTLGWILVNGPDVKEGRELLTRAAQLQPTDPSIRYHLSVALEKDGDRIAAKNELKHALAQPGLFAERDAALKALALLDVPSP